MPDPYSALLLVAIALLVGGAVARLALRLGAQLPVALAPWLMVAAFDVAVIAVAFHLGLGHRPGTDMALDPVDFIVMHPAPWVVLVAAALGWLAVRAR